MWGQDPNRERWSASADLSGEIARTLDGLGGFRAYQRHAPYLRRDAQRKVYRYTPAILRETARLATVLVELNFISNPVVEACMRDAAWQELAAHAIDAGIKAALHQGAATAAP